VDNSGAPGGDLWAKLKHAAIDDNIITATEILVQRTRQWPAKVNLNMASWPFVFTGTGGSSGTDRRDTLNNRAKVQGKAIEITVELRDATLSYFKRFPKGNKADESRPKVEAEMSEQTVGEYFKKRIEGSTVHHSVS